jgi:hypothetical protein
VGVIRLLSETELTALIAPVSRLSAIVSESADLVVLRIVLRPGVGAYGKRADDGTPADAYRAASTDLGHGQLRLAVSEKAVRACSLPESNPSIPLAWCIVALVTPG